MSKSNAYANAWLLLEFNNVDIANIGDATGLRGSSAAGSFYLSLHTADPGEGGDQTTNETSYGGYARVAVARSPAGFTVSGSQATLAAAVTFAQCSSGSATITHFAIGTAASGAGYMTRKGNFPNPPTSLAVSVGVRPELGTGTTITED